MHTSVFIFALLISGVVAAQDKNAALMALTGAGSHAPTLGYEGRSVLGGEGNSKTPSINENNFNVSMPIYKTETDTFSTTINGGSLRLSESLILSSGRAVPNDFYRADIGIQYSHKLPEQRAWGIRGSLGYAGDKINKSTESFNMSANYSYPGSEGQWVLMLIMSNNSPLGAFVPIPGFIYIYRTPTLTGLFGVPIFSMHWTPINPWSFSFSAFGPTLRTEAAYETTDKAQLFTGLAWKQQRYILSERTNKDERLTIEEKNIEVGFRKPLFKGVFSEFQTGNSFNRSIYAGDGLFNREAGTVDLDSNWYLKWSIKAVF